MFKCVHINKIEMSPVDTLSAMEVVSESSCRFSSAVTFSGIDISELVGVTVEDDYNNNQKVFTTKATFKTCSKLQPAGRRMAFRVTSVDGKRFMIGSHARPYPIISEKNPYPERPTDAVLKTVTITWKSMLPMLLIEE